MKSAQRFGALFLVAYAAFALLVVAFGENPAFIALRLLEGTFGSAYGASQVLYKATPILFCAASFEATRRAGLFNVGAEGQLVLGSFAAAWVGALLPAWPPGIGAVLPMLAAAGAGGLLGAFAGWMRARFDAHEVLTTLVCSRIVEALVAYLLAHGAALPGTVRSADIGAGARLPSLALLSSLFRGTAASFALVIAVVAVFVLPWAFRVTSIGREIELTGLGPKVAAIHGVPVSVRWVQAFALSGALAGLCATATVQGYKGYFEQGLGAGAGFSGLAVALVARGNPVGMLVMALVLGALEQGGLFANAYVPRELMTIVVAVVLVVGSRKPAPEGLVRA